MGLPALAWCADAYNPTLTIVALATSMRFGTLGVTRNRLVALVVLLVPVYVGKFALKPLFGLVPDLGLGFSTHIGYAIALTWLICRFARTSLRFIWIPATIVYAAAVVSLGYHGVGDSIFTAAFVCATSWTIFQVLPYARDATPVQA